MNHLAAAMSSLIHIVAAAGRLLANPARQGPSASHAREHPKLLSDFAFADRGEDNSDGVRHLHDSRKSDRGVIPCDD